MRKISVAGILLLAVTASGSAYAVEKHATGKKYEKATITNVEQKAKTRILYYVVNTPITKDEPYYEVTLQMKDANYRVQYTPRHAADTLEEGWQAGASVSVRVDGRHLFIKRDDDTETPFVIVKHTALVAGQPDSKSAPASK